MFWKNRKRKSERHLVPVLSSSFLLLPLLLLLLLDCGRSADATHNDLIVGTSSGRIYGMRHYLPMGRAVDAFVGIPFAKPPIGSLRFRHPQPIDPWKETYNATRPPNSCYQEADKTFGPEFRGSNMWNPPTRVSEDCLYLNIWVPRTAAGATRVRKAAVMVWIFGGGFYSGTPTLKLYDGKVLAAESGVIVVSIGYRIGVFGFFFLSSVSAPANAGMFDQLMALDWIHQNIQAFGGDPNNITLFGESAGAASVSLHLLSPLSRSKFQRAILQSGSANMPWVSLTMAEAKRRSLELAVEIIGCPNTSNMEAIAECMRGISPQTLVEYQYITSNALQFPFLPVIDGNFLTDHPDVLLKQKDFKKCPVLMGSNLNEGSYFLIYELFELMTLTSVKMTRDDFVTSMRKLFFYYPQYRQVTSQAAIDAIIFEYTNWMDPDNSTENALALDRALGDSQFVCPLNRFAEVYSAAGESVYMYYLTQRYENNPWPLWMGVLHGDDVVFVFGDALKPGHNYSRQDKELSRLMITYWTNFAKTGDPNQIPGRENLGVWPRHSTAKREYLELNAQLIVDGDREQVSRAVGRGPRVRECAFWYNYLPSLLLVNNTEETPTVGQSQQQKNSCHGNEGGSSGDVIRSTSPPQPPCCFFFLFLFLFLFIASVQLW